MRDFMKKLLRLPRDNPNKLGFKTTITGGEAAGAPINPNPNMRDNGIYETKTYSVEYETLGGKKTIPFDPRSTHYGVKTTFNGKELGVETTITGGEAAGAPINPNPDMRDNGIYETKTFSVEYETLDEKKITPFGSNSTPNGVNTTGNGNNTTSSTTNTTGVGSDTTSSGGNGDSNSPLDQFTIRDLLSLDAIDASVSLTNIGLYLTLASLIVLIVCLISNNYNKIHSNS